MSAAGSAAGGASARGAGAAGRGEAGKASARPESGCAAGASRPSRQASAEDNRRPGAAPGAGAANVGIWRSLPGVLGYAAFALGCGGENPAAKLPELSVEASESVGTVFTVRWDTPHATRARVQFRVVGEDAHETPWETTALTEHEWVVRGLPVDVEVEIVGIDEEGERTEVWQGRTGNVPTDFVELTVSEREGTWSGGLLTPVIGVTSGVVMFDNRGRIVWWWQSGDSSTRILRAIVKQDKSGIYANLIPLGEQDDPQLVEVDWLGTEVRRAAAAGMDHDFVELPDGPLASIVAIEHEQAGEPCRSNGIAEFEFGAVPVPAWDAWDFFTALEPDCTVNGDAFTHANAIDYDEETDEYTVGSRTFSTLLVVDATTFDLRTSIGQAGEFQAASGEVEFEAQHQFQWLTNDRLLLFDNGAALDRRASRVTELVLDAGSGTYNAEWTYTGDPEQFVYALGDTLRLSSGNTLIDWATSGMLQEVSPEGEVRLQIESELGFGFGYLHHAEGLYVGQDEIE